MLNVGAALVAGFVVGAEGCERLKALLLYEVWAFDGATVLAGLGGDVERSNRSPMLLVLLALGFAVDALFATGEVADEKSPQPPKLSFLDVGAGTGVVELVWTRRRILPAMPTSAAQLHLLMATRESQAVLVYFLAQMM